MAGENNTNTTEDPDDTGAGGEDPPKGGGQLRKKLEDTLTENAELKGKLLVHEAGLGHLTERQRRAVIREAQEDGDVTVESLKAVAKDLYGEAPKNNNSKEGEANQNPNPNQNQNAETEEEDDDEALTNIDAIDRAVRRSRTTPANDGSFEARLGAAKTQAEAESIIRSEGHRVGIVHEWDVE